MTCNRYEIQKEFWENAGSIGYDKAMYSNEKTANHLRVRHWDEILKTAKKLNLGKDSRIIELGCGDGELTEFYLAPNFKSIDAFDCSEGAIKRANLKSNVNNVTYHLENLTDFNYQEGSQFDGAFMIGFVHHVKAYTPEIIARISKICPKVILLEPNGDNLIRKGLEKLPSYIKAGEDSFKLKELVKIFKTNGYELKEMRKMTFVPAFTPRLLFPPLKIMENIVESNPITRKLCATYILGFESDRIL